MPSAIIPVIASAFTAIGVTGSVAGVTYATIAAWVVVTALSLGVSYALAAMAKKPKQSSQQQTVKQAIPARQRVYGCDKVGGALCFYETYGGTLYQVIAHCQGPVGAIVEYWLNDVNAGPAISGGAPMPWGDKLRAASTSGLMGQDAFAELVAATGGVWSPAHRLAGVCATLMVCKSAGSKFNAKVWPTGVPQLRVVLRGQADIYDPRDGGTRWTENAALIIRDYLVSADGFRISPSMIDDASFAGFADICDQLVARASGVAEMRYRISTTIDLASAEPRAVLATLLRGCDASIAPTADGRIAIRGGVYVAPTTAIGDDDIILYDYANSSGRAAAFNRLKITCKDVTDYQPVECAPWEDVADQAARGVLQQDFDAQIMPSFTQARRLAKIFAMRSNPRYRFTLTVTYAAALRLWGEANFILTLTELGVNAAPFAITRIAFDLDALTGSIDCASEEPSAYEWSVTEEGPAPIVATTTGSIIAIAAAPAPTLTLERTPIATGYVMSRIVASIPEVADVDGARFEIRRSGETSWTRLINQSDFVGRSDGLEDGATYEARALYMRGTVTGGGEYLGDPSSLVALTIVSNPIPPASSGSALAASSGGGMTIMVLWTTPPTPDYALTRIYLSQDGAFASAVAKAVSYAGPSTPASVSVTTSTLGEQSVFVRAFNGSGVGAAPLGPITVTV